MWWCSVQTFTTDVICTKTTTCFYVLQNTWLLFNEFNMNFLCCVENHLLCLLYMIHGAFSTTSWKTSFCAVGTTWIFYFLLYDGIHGNVNKSCEKCRILFIYAMGLIMFNWIIIASESEQYTCRLSTGARNNFEFYEFNPHYMVGFGYVPTATFPCWKSFRK